MKSSYYKWMITLRTVSTMNIYPVKYLVMSNQSLLLNVDRL